MAEPDNKFFDRADAHIALCNDQLTNASKGEVSASMVYSTTRFNAWVSAAGWKDGKEMEEAKQETITYFVERYKTMLEANLDEYIKNYDFYMNKKK